MANYAGLDVHSKMTAFVIQDEGGETLAEGELPTTPEGLSKLGDHGLAPGSPVALETGTVSFFVARQLSKLGYKPVVVDAREVRDKAHRKKQKADGKDAREICEGLRRGFYRCIVHVPSLATSKLREALSRRRHFVRMRTQQVNAVKRLLRSAGLARRNRSLQHEGGWDRLEESLADEPELLEYVQMHRGVWQLAGEKIKRIGDRLEELGREHEATVERLQTVPGVGPIVALTVVAAYSDVKRFPTAKHAASYAGLVPSTHHSGDRESYGRITKEGSAELRSMLCEAAHHARRDGHPLNPYFSKLCAKRGYKMAVVAVAHRLARIIFAMMRDEKDFDVGKLNVERGPFTKTSVRTYRLKKQGQTA